MALALTSRWRSWAKRLSLSLVFCTLALPSGRAAAGDGHPPMFGYLEDALLLPQGFPIKAKLDTGADNSSVNAEVVRRFERDGKQWLVFVVESIDGRKLELERQVLRTARIKRHDGKAQRRPVVLLTICIGNIAEDVPVNLVDRTKYTYNLLIGRSFMAKRVVVDPGRQFTTKPNCGKERTQ